VITCDNCIFGGWCDLGTGICEVLDEPIYPPDNCHNPGKRLAYIIQLGQEHISKYKERSEPYCARSWNTN
jgi:hypothetical protein